MRYRNSALLASLVGLWGTNLKGYNRSHCMRGVRGLRPIPQSRGMLAPLGAEDMEGLRVMRYSLDQVRVPRIEETVRQRFQQTRTRVRQQILSIVHKTVGHLDPLQATSQQNVRQINDELYDQMQLTAGWEMQVETICMAIRVENGSIPRLQTPISPSGGTMFPQTSTGFGSATCRLCWASLQQGRAQASVGLAESKRTFSLAQSRRTI